jgi:hypothetical protein
MYEGNKDCRSSLPFFHSIWFRSPPGMITEKHEISLNLKRPKTKSLTAVERKKGEKKT